jgi:hypothetical protein
MDREEREERKERKGRHKEGREAIDKKICECQVFLIVT